MLRDFNGIPQGSHFPDEITSATQHNAEAFTDSGILINYEDGGEVATADCFRSYHGFSLFLLGRGSDLWIFPITLSD
jgi:hypothetical protein